MSSKEKYTTLGPSNGMYQHKAVPAKDEDIPEFLQDEFLSLGGIVNGILEGGAFPPYSVMPQRWREGMLIYFQQAVLPTNGTFQHITSAGIWLYRDARWWKVIDDPSVLEFSVFAYALTATNDAPLAPLTGLDMPPLADPGDPGIANVWYVTPPEKPNKGWYIWASAMFSIDIDGVRMWESPVIWSAGIVDGIQGEDGETYLMESRYFASTATPPLDSGTETARIPTTGGLEWKLAFPETTADEIYIWRSYGQIDVNRDILVGTWSAPARYATPQTGKPARAYTIGTDFGYPPFTPEGNPLGELPGVDWSYEAPEPATSEDFVWGSDRTEWIAPGDPEGPGEAMTTWTTPIRYSGISPDFVETRYYSSTIDAVIDSATVLERVPTTGGVDWTVELAAVSHPDKSFVWATTATFAIDNRNLTGWSDPTKHSTPDNTETATAWYRGVEDDWNNGFSPPFDSAGIPPDGLPGIGWVYDQPDMSETAPVWHSSRLEWSSGEPQTSWSDPFVFNSRGAIPGAGFYTLPIDPLLTSWPNDATLRFFNHVGRDPVLDDILTMSNGKVAPNDYSETRIYEPISELWEEGYVIDGNIIATGTIAGDRITAATEITAPFIKTGVLQGTTGSFEGTLQSGSTQTGSIEIYDPASFVTFSVDSGGNVNANSMIIRDNIQIISDGQPTNVLRIGPIPDPEDVQTGFTVDGAGFMTASGFNVGGGSITGGNILGSSIAVGSPATFSVDGSTGYTFWTDALGAAKVIFNPAISEFTFSGTLDASDVVGGTINVPNITSPLFKVESSGVMTCTNAVVDGAITTGVGSILEGAYIKSLTVDTLQVTNQAITRAVMVEHAQIDFTGGTVYHFPLVDIGPIGTGGVSFNIAGTGYRSQNSSNNDENILFNIGFLADGVLRQEYSYQQNVYNAWQIATVPCLGMMVESLMAPYVGQAGTIRVTVQISGYSGTAHASYRGYLLYAMK